MFYRGINSSLGLNVLILFTSGLVGCVTGLTREARNVTVFKGSPAFDCRLVGQFKGLEANGVSRSADEASATNQILNQAAKINANWVRLSEASSRGFALGTNVSGDAFRCQSNNMQLLSDCQAGEANACANYVVAAWKEDRMPTVYKYSDRACALGNQKSCKFMKKVTEQKTKEKKACLDGSGADCDSFAVYNGQIGDDVTAAVFLKKGCELEDASSCTHLEMMREYETREAKAREADERSSRTKMQQASEMMRIEQMQSERSTATQVDISPMMNYLNSINPPKQERQQTNCTSTPIYDFSGKYVRTDTNCNH